MVSLPLDSPACIPAISLVCNVRSNRGTQGYQFITIGEGFQI